MGATRYVRWQNSMRRRGLLASLAAARYTIWMYVPFADWGDNPFAYGFSTHLDFYEREIGVAGTEFYDFLHIWLVGLAPTPLTNEAYPWLVSSAIACTDYWSATCGRSPVPTACTPMAER